MTPFVTPPELVKARLGLMNNSYDPAKSQVSCGHNLPNLLYVGDVPVEADMHGSALMYRLLEDYPKEKLHIIEVFGASSLDRRLAGTEYRVLKTGLYRLLWTRFHYHVSPIVTLGAPFFRHRIPKILGGFRPEALITVVHGYSWATAAAYAEQHKLPLHLILHDECAFPERFAVERRWIEGRLRYWYPRAASRLCVSPFMEETYRDRYGAVGDVLYPSRGKDALSFTEPAPSLQGPCVPFTVAFGGSIHLEYAQSLQRIAVALQSSRGRLIVYGPYQGAAVHGYLQEPNIELRGKVSSEELIRQCRNEAHAMFIPMSYHEKHRLNMKIAFPSKLADSTAIGLPLVIDGPEYCSAVRWARQNPGVAEVVTSQDVNLLIAAISRLQDRAYRYRLAAEAISRGIQYFARERAVKLLYAKLNAARFLDIGGSERSRSMTVISAVVSRPIHRDQPRGL
jgi:hypothetical protein